jgi:seryl-tRNA synthetase
MQAMGYLQHGGLDEVYAFDKDDLVLVGTAEQSIGPYHMDEILEEKQLPLRYVGFSTCFRREAGSYGKDTRGILRVHQFDKLEMFSFCHPDKSDAEHDYLVSLEEKILQGLKLPYHVLKMCTGDLGDVSARRYDIETWLPSEQRYRETHSCSQVWDFQSRRLNIKYRDSQTGKNEYVHLLNGTAAAIGRLIIMIIENYQQADGSILIPEALRPWMMGKEKITGQK